MARRPMGTIVKPGLTFGWVVKWKSGLNFVGIPVNDVISTFVHLYTKYLRSELKGDNDKRDAIKTWASRIDIIKKQDKTIPAHSLPEIIIIFFFYCNSFERLSL